MMDYSKLTDEHLAGIVRTGDDEQRNQAFEALYSRYQAELRRYASAFTSEWREDFVQNTWLGLYRVIRREPIKEELSHLLRRIAARQRSEVLRKLVVEKRRSSDVPLEELEEESPETSYNERSDVQFIRWSPAIDNTISQCEKTAWILCGQLGFPHQFAARIMGEKVEEVRNLYRNAKRRIEKRMRGREYEIDLQLHEIKDREPQLLQKPRGLLLERNDHSIIPQLSEEELRLVGLTQVELAKYRASLLFPRDHYGWISETKKLYLVLTRKESPSLEALMEKAEHTKATQPVLLTPSIFLFEWAIPDWYLMHAAEEHILEVTRIGENIVLSPIATVQFIPNNYSSMLKNSTIIRNPEELGVNIVFPLFMHSASNKYAQSVLPISIFCGASAHLNVLSATRRGVGGLEEFLLEQKRPKL